MVNAIKIVSTTWEKDKTTLEHIRRTVFINEQKVPEALEWDEYDANATHFLAIQGKQAIACARLLQNGKITRMAVLAKHRNKHVGATLLAHVVQHACTAGISTVKLDAQLDAVGFYQKYQFVAQGEVFMDAGIPHVYMSRNI